MRGLEELRSFQHEVGPIRPPSEGGSCSLLLRVTRNCPWSLCKFCYGKPYGRGRFSIRGEEEVKEEVRGLGRAVEILQEVGEKAWELLPDLPDGGGGAAAGGDGEDHLLRQGEVPLQEVGA
jgi:hypothetical protein